VEFVADYADCREQSRAAGIAGTANESGIVIVNDCQLTAYGEYRGLGSACGHASSGDRNGLPICRQGPLPTPEKATPRQVVSLRHNVG
jgi:hypothetical protein